MTRDHLNKIRYAITILDQAANRLPIEERGDRLLHTELQDAADGLIEVREELMMYLQAKANLRSVLG